jgi:hypothetical protein
MLSPRTLAAVERLLSAFRRSVFAREDTGAMLCELIDGENLPDLLAQLPADLVSTFEDSLNAANAVALADDHLQPERSPFELRAELDRYYARLRKLLCTPRERESCQAQVLCLPSFEQDWSLWVTYRHRFGDYALLFRRAESSIWEAAGGEPNVECLERVLDGSALANRIVAAWTKVLKRTSYRGSGSDGLDGVTYHFLASNMAGWTWSPDADTVPGKAVELAHLLCSFVEAGEHGGHKSLRQVESLLSWFEQLSY